MEGGGGIRESAINEIKNEHFGDKGKRKSEGRGTLFHSINRLPLLLLSLFLFFYLA